MNRFALFLLIAAAPLMGAKPPAPKPDVPVPGAFRNQPVEADKAAPAHWWKAFGDPFLDELIGRASHANLDLRKAGARLAEAYALRGGAKSALLPSIDSTASAVQLRGGLNQGVIRAPGERGGSFVTPFESALVSAGFNMRWEADVFGGLRKSFKAAGAEAQAVSEALRDLQVLVRSEVARNYIELRAAEEQMAIVNADVASEKDLLDLIRARADAGLASRLDVERQAAQLSAVRAELPELDAQRLRAAHRIAVLLGEYPAALVDRLASASERRLAVPPVPAAVPSELLRRRPDIRRAEAQIAAAYARAGAARADLYPKFVITGLSGRQSTNFSGLTVGAGNFFSFGPGISLPIFNFGKIRSNIAAQDARLEQATRSYEQDVLAAFEETENAFVARDRAEQRRRELETGLDAARQSVALARDLYVSGLGDFLAVLDAQRRQFQIERELASSRAAVLLGAVRLYKALGE
ncbi:MAG: efflux transporter outer membrane subunit [Acidobacteria bacterium]|nr:efflux transporter outer membrane subunit [Acidobacteriota bacterium]